MSRADFWARRKAAVEAEANAEAQALAASEAAAREAELEEKTDEDVLRELDLPDPDTLQEGDDFKVFLTKAVPARIRTRALRRLWLTNPVLANVDGLVDYGEDFSDGAKVVEALQTAYQVGKGMTKHVDELARQAEAAESDDSDLDVAAAESHDENADADSILSHSSPEDEVGNPTALADAGTGKMPAVSDSDNEEPLPIRRMRFAFDDGGTET